MTIPGVRREQPRPGQESVWDYPRPPRVEATTERVIVELGGTVLVHTTDALRVLERVGSGVLGGALCGIVVHGVGELLSRSEAMVVSTWSETTDKGAGS